MTPREIAQLITEDPDVFNEGIREVVALLAALGLGTGHGRMPEKQPPKPIVQTAPLQTQETPKSTPKPKYLKKPQVKGAAGDVIDKVWTKVGQIVGKKPNKLTKADFRRVYKLYADQYGGGRLTRDALDKLLGDAGVGYYNAIRALIYRSGFDQVDLDDSGSIEWDEILKSVPPKHKKEIGLD